MENIDYTASSTLLIFPWKTGFAGMPTDSVNVSFAHAIERMLNLTPEERERAHIEVTGRSKPVRIDEAQAIYKRPDFPRD
jgi:hypothetical protein